jgi:hypothetical protein
MTWQQLAEVLRIASALIAAYAIYEFLIDLDR